MKRLICKCMMLLTVMTGVLCTPVLCHTAENIDKSDRIPIYGTDVKDGTYSIEVESSSSMFRIVKAELTVKSGEMTADLTLSGKGYLNLYMGTGEEALEAEASEYIPFLEDKDGVYTYTVPVEVLNQEVDCAAFSKRKEKWYDRQLVFRADTLPKDALLKPIVPVNLEVKDGDYAMEVSLSGGTGKAKILSPASVIVKENQGTARIEWNSPNYDYMVVNGQKILPVNTEGNSVFEIPVWAVDEEMSVLADTTAMSVPHEIEYTLVFHSDTLKGERSVLIIGICIAGIVIAGIGIIIIMRRKKKSAHA